VNSVTQKQFDAAISHISISPLLPVAEMPVIVSATVENIGRLSIPVTEILLYRDVNSDSIFIDAELLARQSLPSLAAGESLVVNFSLAPFPQGTYRIGASIAFSQDDDPDNNIALFDLSIGLPPRSIVINEVMYAPSGDIPEWIEGYNISVSPVDIHGWRISDNGTAKGIVQSHSPVVPSGTFFIITTDTVQLKNSFVVDAPLFQAQFSALNNTTVDAVVLFDERGIVMDSISYRPAWGGTNGSSLQRYDPSAPSTDSANWLSDFPSPGIENESVRKDFDITLHRIAAEKIPDGFLITIVALNSGRYRADSARVHLYGDTIPLIGNIIFSSNISPVDPLDSAVITFEWHTKLSGRKHLLATMDYPRDMRLQNNFGSISVVNSFPLQTMVINEIMYEPFVGNSEFVELMNRTSDTVDIAGWALVDQPGTSGNRTTIAFSQHSHPIAPGTFAVIASDSAIFTQFPDLTQQNIFIHTALSLSNSGEDLVLLDISGSTIDSLRYSPSWHIKNLSVSGRSIERIDPSGNSADERNWSSSVSRNGSSPMQKNSVFIGSKSPAAALGLSPNPFSPDQDGFEDFLSINYSLPSNSATIRIRIYDVTGRLIRRLAQQEPSPSTGSVVWNGCDDNGNPVRIGMYIVLFEALDNFGGMVLTAKDVAVVARKL
ncbi:MAG: lamin tail domain-containing protein, partial [Bacteroidota bacterium]